MVTSQDLNPQGLQPVNRKSDALPIALVCKIWYIENGTECEPNTLVNTIFRWIGYCRAHEMHATSQQATVAAVQPASHHRPSFGTSPPLKPPASLDAERFVHRSPPARPPPVPLPTALSLASVSATTAAGCMIGSLSHPLVGSMRQTGPKTTATQKATTLPTSLLADDDYMHRFRYSYMQTFIKYMVPLHCRVLLNAKS